MMDKISDNDFLTTTGMTLVMCGGNAREYIREAISKIPLDNIDEVNELLKKANDELIQGHKAQTQVLQMECSGEPQGYNVLFCHGMDTLMTVKSEYEIACLLIKMFEVLRNEKR